MALSMSTVVAEFDKELAVDGDSHDKGKNTEAPQEGRITSALETQPRVLRHWRTVRQRLCWKS
jgi:hypothetical protein